MSEIYFNSSPPYKPNGNGNSNPSTPGATPNGRENSVAGAGYGQQANSDNTSPRFTSSTPIHPPRTPADVSAVDISLHLDDEFGQFISSPNTRQRRLSGGTTCDQIVAITQHFRQEENEFGGNDVILSCQSGVGKNSETQDINLNKAMRLVRNSSKIFLAYYQYKLEEINVNINALLTKRLISLSTNNYEHEVKQKLSNSDEDPLFLKDFMSGKLIIVIFIRVLWLVRKMISGVKKMISHIEIVLTYHFFIHIFALY
tara:strand:+ start:382 stop:1152 length:771 start_codon:yes stop_codon:yes gene_type:complete